MKRATRTLMQLIAGGGITVLVDATIGELASQPIAVAAVMVAATYVVSFAQNWLEDHGKIPAVLKD